MNHPSIYRESLNTENGRGYAHLVKDRLAENEDECDHLADAHEWDTCSRFFHERGTCYGLARTNKPSMTVLT